MNLTGAEVRGANFENTTSRGFTASQLYSTASYQAQDLTGIHLNNNDLSGWVFAGQNLTKASFNHATLTNSDFSRANLTYAGFDYATLTNADFRQANLTNASFWYAALTDADFSRANLTNAYFSYASLTNADLTGAEVRGANFGSTTRRGFFTASQLYSTASYQAQDLAGIHLGSNDLNGWNFAGQNLANANFRYAVITNTNFRQAYLTNVDFVFATLTYVDLTGADLRGTSYVNLRNAIVTNLILRDGAIDGLNLSGDQSLLVRDYDGNPDASTPIDSMPVTIKQQFMMENGGDLQLRFEADAWGSTISFEPGIPVSLGGTLNLDFAADVEMASQVGRTLNLFDWTGVLPTGEFTVESPYAWNLTDLYSTGEVTFLGVPEPSSYLLLLFAALALLPSVRAQAKK